MHGTSIQQYIYQFFPFSDQDGFKINNFQTPEFSSHMQKRCKYFMQLDRPIDIENNPLMIIVFPSPKTSHFSYPITSLCTTRKYFREYHRTFPINENGEEKILMKCFLLCLEIGHQQNAKYT